MSLPKLLALTNYGGTGGVLRLGKATYNIPSDAQVRHVEGLAYVLDRSGEIYLFTRAGQVEIPRTLAPSLIAKHFPTEAGVSPHGPEAEKIPS